MDAAAVGALAAIIAALIAAWATFRATKRAKKPSQPNLSIVNFLIERPLVSDPRRGMLLDFTVRNTGEQPALINSIAINCIRSINFEYLEPPSSRPLSAGAPLPPSMTVGVDIPLVPAPFSIAKPISQRVPPNELDRFTVSCSIAHPGGTRYTLYVLNCGLAAEGGASTILTRNFIAGAGAWLSIPPVSVIRKQVTDVQRDVGSSRMDRELVSYVDKRIDQLKELEPLLLLASFEPDVEEYQSLSLLELRERIVDLQALHASLVA